MRKVSDISTVHKGDNTLCLLVTLLGSFTLGHIRMQTMYKHSWPEVHSQPDTEQIHTRSGRASVRPARLIY